MKRLYSICLAGLLASAGLIFFATGQDWVLADVPRPDPLPDGLKVATGGAVLPGLAAVAVVLLAAVVAVAATRRVGRRVVGAVVALTGVVGIVLVVPFLTGTPSSALAEVRDHGTNVPGGYSEPGSYLSWMVLVAGLIAVSVGIAVAIWGPSWTQMGRKYERPEAVSTSSGQPRAKDVDQNVDQRDAWNSLDQGIDPT